MAPVAGTQEVITVPIGDIILNLDELVQEQKFVMYGGEKHIINPPNVEGYLRLLLAKRKLLKENGGVEDEYIQSQQIIALITGCIPTIPVETVRSFSLTTLQKIAEAIEEASGNTDKLDAQEDDKGTKGE